MPAWRSPTRRFPPSSPRPAWRIPRLWRRSGARRAACTSSAKVTEKDFAAEAAAEKKAAKKPAKKKAVKKADDAEEAAE